MDSYTLNHGRRGYALIINVLEFDYFPYYGEEPKYRHGGFSDTVNLKNTLQYLGFVVDFNRTARMTGAQIREKIRELAERNHDRSDMVVVAVSSHGTFGNIVLASDEEIAIEELVLPFEYCHSLAGKPKLFFINSCNGGESQIAPRMLPGYPDLLIALSSMPYQNSYRSRRTGSKFMSTLCGNLLHFRDLTLIQILNQTKQDLEHWSSITQLEQYPVVWDMLTRDLFMSPNWSNSPPRIRGSRFDHDVEDMEWEAESSADTYPQSKTFRLEIKLPHKQKTFLSVKPDLTLQDVLNEVCREKLLDACLFTLRNPGNPDQQLDMYRKIGEERTNVVDLIPAVEDAPVRDNRKFGTSSQINMEPPGSHVYEKKGFGDIFRMCRKKRSHAPKHFAPVDPSMTREFPLKNSRDLSESMVSLGTDYNSARDFPSRPSNKRPALQNGRHEPENISPTTEGRVRHNSESSGFNESVVLSISPERDGCLADDQQSPSPVNDVVSGDAKWSKPVPTPRSTTSTPDSALKSTSEAGTKMAAGASRKKAPAPLPPGNGKEAVGKLSRSGSVCSPEVKADSRSPSGSRRIISRQISATSVSSRETNGSTNDKQGLLQNNSSDTLQSVTPVEKPKAERGDDIGSFSFEDTARSTSGSVVGENFDAESSDGSVGTGRNVIQSEVDVHSPPASIHEDRNLEWDSNSRAPDDEPEVRTSSVSSVDSWAHLRKGKGQQDEKDAEDNRSPKSPSVSISDVQIHENKVTMPEVPSEESKKLQLVNKSHSSKHALTKTPSIEPEVLSSAQQPTSSKPSSPEVVPLSKPSPLPKLFIPPVTQHTPSQPSPSPSTSSTATSLSSLREPPPLPDSTPPVVAVPVKPKFIRADLTSAPTGSETKPASRDELLKEMKLVQEMIGSMNEQLQKIHQKPNITNKDLAVIEEYNRTLKEHYQKQMALTEQLLEKSEQLKREPTPPPSGWERLGLVRSESGKEEKNKVGNNFLDWRKNFAAASLPIQKVPVVIKHLGSIIPDENRPIYSVDTNGNELLEAKLIKNAPAEMVKIRTRPKAAHRDSWVVEASRRFDFSEPTSGSTSPPTPTSATTKTPPQPKTAPVFDSTNVSTDKFAITNRRASQIFQDRQSSMTAPLTPKPLLGQISVKDQPRRSSIIHEQYDPLLSPKPFHKFSAKDPTRSLEKPKATQPGVHISTIVNADPVESLVRSWKNGTPTPYHHVNVDIGKVTALPVVAPNEGKVRKNRFIAPPPPPPKFVLETERGISTPLKPMNERPEAQARSNYNGPTSGDTKDVLMSEIRNFSVNYL